MFLNISIVFCSIPTLLGPLCPCVFNETPQNELVEKQSNTILRQPFPELSDEHKEYLDDVLDYWQSQTAGITSFEYDFNRYIYDEAFLNLRNSDGRLYARTMSVGTIRFAAADKWQYETTQSWKFHSPPKSKDHEPKYERTDESEKWMRNGKSLFEFQYAEKRLIERKVSDKLLERKVESSDSWLGSILNISFYHLDISNGPHSILFHQNADKLKERFWIRVITPEDSKGAYWLELWPKRKVDAACMQKMELVLSESDFRPSSLTIFAVNHDAPNGKTRKTILKFTERTVRKGKANPKTAISCKFKLPSSWQKIAID